MGVHCTRCDGTGFLNIHQVPEGILDAGGVDAVLKWQKEQPQDSHDVVICDCCGDGDEGWNDEPGEHSYDEKTFDCM